MDNRRRQFQTTDCPALSSFVPGFTLVELLIVIGIIAILIALLLPTLSRVRDQARQTACASQLHQLVVASQMYLNDNHRYPLANYNPAAGTIFTDQFQDRLGNDLAPYLSLHLPSQAITSADLVYTLPKVMVCPVWADVETYLPSFPGGTPVYWYASFNYWFTGYDYMGWLSETPNNAAVIIQPNRVSSCNGEKRGVLWCDTLGRSTFYGPPTWIFFNLRGSTRFNGIGPGDPSSLVGQNRAWSDGSVEWVTGKSIDTQAGDIDTAASYKVGPPGAYYSYSWF